MTSRRRWILGFGVALGGAASIGGGYLLREGDRTDYLSGVLVEMGAALLLLIPLLILERMFARQVTRVRTETAGEIQRIDQDAAQFREETAAEIGSLQRALEKRLSARTDADEKAVKAVEEEVSFENLRDLFDRAQELGAVSRRGIRVRLSGQWSRIHFQSVTSSPREGAAEPMIWLHLEDARGGKLGPSAIWSPGEHVAEVMTRFTESWQQAGSYPGKGAIDPDAIFARLIEALDVGIRSRTGNEWRGEPLDKLIELPTRSWALTDFGLQHVGSPGYGISVSDIVTDPPMRRRHMLEKNWVQAKANEFEEAFEAAEMLFERPKKFQRPIS